MQSLRRRHDLRNGDRNCSGHETRDGMMKREMAEDEKRDDHDTTRNGSTTSLPPHPSTCPTGPEREQNPESDFSQSPYPAVA